MQKAPPKSFRTTQGQGSRSWFIVAVGSGESVVRCRGRVVLLYR